MQETSDLFKQIWANPNHWSEVKVNINGVDYFEDSLMSVSIQMDAFNDNKLTIGAAPVGSCRVELITDNMAGTDLSALIPSGAKIQIYERLHGTVFTPVGCIVGQVKAGEAVAGGTATVSEAESEWLIQGTFYVDYRDSLSTTGVLTLDGLDIMAKADAMFPSNDSAWPAPDYGALGLIASAMGVPLDETTLAVVQNAYPIALPVDRTMREVLGYIAAMYGGNFVITKDEKLLLLQYTSLPSTTNRLITEDGDWIKVGGDYIVV